MEDYGYYRCSDEKLRSNVVSVASLSAKGVCDEKGPGDGKKPVRDEPKGGSGRQDTGHGQRSIANDDRGKNGHGGHKDSNGRPASVR